MSRYMEIDFMIVHQLFHKKVDDEKNIDCIAKIQVT